MTLFLKRILYWLPFLLLVLLMSLSFYQHPIADDFVGYYFVSKIGIAGSIKSFLLNGTGRYFVVSVFILVCASRFFIEHYFILPIFFFIITYCNLFYFIREVRLAFFKGNMKLRHLHWLTANGILLFLSSIAEVSSFFMWITTCCIFLLSFNVLLFYARLLIRNNFNEIVSKRKWSFILQTICVVLLAGCEETTLYFSLLLNVFVCYLFWQDKKRLRFLAFILLLQLACIAIVSSIPGNLIRVHHFSQRQAVYYSLFSSFYQTIIVLFRIVSNPLFLFFAVLGIVFCPEILDEPRKKMETMNVSYKVLFLAIVTAVCFFYFFIRHFGGRIVPEYANNLLICYLLIIFFIMLFLKSYLFKDIAILMKTVFKRYAQVVYLIAISLFVLSRFSAGLLQSLVTAPVHNKVCNDRIVKINQAKAAGKNSVSFNNYEDECIAISNKYGNKAGRFVKNFFQYPPQYIYILNKGLPDFGYASYYGIDTIYINSTYILSRDKAKIPLWPSH